MTEIIEVPVPAELLDALNQRVRLHHASGRSEFILELLRKELRARPEAAPAPTNTIEQALAPFHAAIKKSGYTDEEVDRIFDEALWQTPARGR